MYIYIYVHTIFNVCICMRFTYIYVRYKHAICNRFNYIYNEYICVWIVLRKISHGQQPESIYYSHWHVLDQNRSCRGRLCWVLAYYFTSHSTLSFLFFFPGCSSSSVFFLFFFAGCCPSSSVFSSYCHSPLHTQQYVSVHAIRTWHPEWPHPTQAHRWRSIRGT